MRVVAVCLTFGRVELGELLTQWARQSVRVPLFLLFDGEPPPIEYLPPGVTLELAAQQGAAFTVGVLMAEAVERARRVHQLDLADGVMVIDDDDYYSPRHVEVTLQALERAEWTGAQRIGIQWRPGQMPPEIVESGWGPGQHATWAYRLRAYDRVGGYGDDAERFDVLLGQRMGWTRCTTHRSLTHVRRQFGYASVSSPAVRFDRARLHATVPKLGRIQPAQWRDDLEVLERWALANQAG